MTGKEKISLENGVADAWICICGNTPCGGGFFPCDQAGSEVEPTVADWTSGLYACTDCRRMIDPNSLNVVSKAAMPVKLL